MVEALGFEFLLLPPGADTEHQTSSRQAVERGN